MKTTRRTNYIQRKTTLGNVGTFLLVAFLSVLFGRFCANVVAADDFPVFSAAAFENVDSENLESENIGNRPVLESAAPPKRSSERIFFTKLGSESGASAASVPAIRPQNDAERGEISIETPQNVGLANNDFVQNSDGSKNNDVVKIAASVVQYEENHPKTPILSNDSPASGGCDSTDDSVSSLKSKKSGTSSFFGALVTGVGALTLVIGVFLALVFLLKILAPNKFTGASNATALVDSSFVGGKVELMTIRWGNKLILASRSPDNKVSRLAETSDPEEIAEILDAAARSKKSVSDAANRWKNALKSIKSFRSAKMWTLGVVLSTVFSNFASSGTDGIAFGQEGGTAIPAATAKPLPTNPGAHPGGALLGVDPNRLDFGAPSLNTNINSTEKTPIPVAQNAAENVAKEEKKKEENVANISANAPTKDDVFVENGEPTAPQDDLKNAQPSFFANGPEALSGVKGWFGPEGISASLKTILTLSILTLAPAILLMTTSFVRLSVVLALLRQAIGAGQVPSNQVTTALAIFLTLLIMTPVWTDVYNDAVVPYSNGEISDVDAFQRGQAPIRTFLWKQIEKTGNVDAIWLFMRYIPDAETPQFYEDVPWRALAPAFLLSELKTAFLIGFQIFIPFLVVDVVISCVLVSTGMMMLPPAVVSLPFKLALFVLTDGWTLVVKSLLESFAWGTGA